MKKINFFQFKNRVRKYKLTNHDPVTDVDGNIIISYHTQSKPNVEVGKSIKKVDGTWEHYIAELYQNQFKL